MSTQSLTPIPSPKSDADSGSMSVHQAGQELGSQYAVYLAIANGELQTRRDGRRHSIPLAEWEKWKSTRTTVPPGYVALASIRDRLGIQSDKLSEYARAGLIPTATQCKLTGAGRSATKFGTWYLDKDVAQELLSARHAGKPMPWHGRPNLTNLRKTYQRWLARKHPTTCSACNAIWGEMGIPKSWDAYAKRYPALSLPDKRHLTMRWSPGLSGAHGAMQASITDAAQPRPGRTLDEAAAALRRSLDWVHEQIQSGQVVPGQAPWDRHQTYLSASMFRRLTELASGGRSSRSRLPEGTWMSLSQAASDAGVSVTTITKWAKGDGLKRIRLGGTGDWRYELQSLRDRACHYWQHEARGASGQPPAWLPKASSS